MSGKERPILFSSEMVLALLAGTKTQTRRAVRVDERPVSVVAGKKQCGFPANAQNVRRCDTYWKCDAPPGSDTVSSRVPSPYGLEGDRLWVRETHARFAVGNRSGTAPQCVAYRATCDADGRFNYLNNGDEIMSLQVTKWTPSIFMPRWASRITLEITEVRVQRLRDISDADAKAEGTLCWICGARYDGHSEADCECFHSDGRDGLARASYALLWDQINSKREGCAWADNPFVWCVSFRVLPKAEAL